MARRATPPYKKGRGYDTFAIVADGPTEKWYFQLMNQEENLRLPIEYFKMEGRLEDAYQRIESEIMVQGFTKVFWIVDFDVLIKEDRERKAGTVSPIEVFSRIQGEASAKYQQLEIYVNNPCLEFWYLLHFTDTARHYQMYEPDLRRDLQKVLPGYEKKESFYKQANNIYRRLQPMQAVAVSRADGFPPFDVLQHNRASAEICKVVQRLRAHAQP